MRCGYGCTLLAVYTVPLLVLHRGVSVASQLRAVRGSFILESMTVSLSWAKGGTSNRHKSSPPFGELVLVDDSSQERYRSTETTR